MVEKAKFDLVKKIGKVEIRKYPELLLATVGNDDFDSGFGLLFRYISGENRTRKKISMTAPVITSENIPMTAPVISKKNYMAFVMPSDLNNDNVPIPTNSDVIIKTEPAKCLAVIQFSGRTNSKLIEKYIQKLFYELKINKLKSIGEPILMRYNSPFTPGFLRRNEIGIEISNFEGC
jgi:hypothetical protein